MKAFEIIFNDEGKVMGDQEIDINTLSRVTSGWMQYGKFIPDHKILITRDENLTI